MRIFSDGGTDSDLPALPARGVLRGYFNHTTISTSSRVVSWVVMLCGHICFCAGRLCCGCQEKKEGIRLVDKCSVCRHRTILESEVQTV